MLRAARVLTRQFNRYEASSRIVLLYPGPFFSRNFTVRPVFKRSFVSASSAVNNDASIQPEPVKKRAKTENKPPSLASQLRGKLLKALHASDFAAAESIYLQLEKEHSKHLEMKELRVLYELFLTFCCRQDHLKYVQRIFNFLRENRLPLSEQSYFPLIRCYADAKDSKSILKALEEMKTAQIIPRARVLQPLFALCYEQRNLSLFIHAISLLFEYQLLLKPQELGWFLSVVHSTRVAATTSPEALEEYRNLLPSIDQILTEASTQLLGMTSSEFQKLLQEFNDLASEVPVTELGILVDRKESLAGAIVNEEQYERDGSFTALNTVFEDPTMHITDSAPLEKRAPQQLRESVRFTPTKFIDVSQVQKLSNLSLYSSTTRRQGKIQSNSSNNSSNDSSLDPQESDALAALIHISTESRSCPHCQAELQQFQLSEEQKLRAKQGIYLAAKRANPTFVQYLETFENKLKMHEYDFVIDGANVAYSHSKQFNGRFSYKQIEILVKKLLSMGKKPLVILRSVYGFPKDTIPNSLLSGSTRVHGSERALLAQLMRDKQLYIVPSMEKLYDDWFWVLATLQSHTANPVYAISNDLIRDVRTCFPDTAAFLKWRNAQMVYFNIERFYPNSSEGGNNLRNKDRNYASYLPHDMKIEGQAHLFFPAKCSRTIQYTPESKRWHIPALDINAWLCVDLNPFRK